jgi:hypothetical protein
MLADSKPLRKLKFKPGSDRRVFTIGEYSYAVGHQIVVDGDWPFEPTFFSFDPKVATPEDSSDIGPEWVLVRGADFLTYSVLLTRHAQFRQGGEKQSRKYNDTGYALVKSSSVVDIP